MYGGFGKARAISAFGVGVALFGGALAPSPAGAGRIVARVAAATTTTTSTPPAPPKFTGGIPTSHSGAFTPNLGPVPAPQPVSSAVTAPTASALPPADAEMAGPGPSALGPPPPAAAALSTSVAPAAYASIGYVAGGEVYFIGNDAPNGIEVWISNTFDSETGEATGEVGVAARDVWGGLMTPGAPCRQFNPIGPVTSDPSAVWCPGLLPTAVDLLGGNDSVLFRSTYAGNVPFTLPARAYGGSGDDTMTAHALGPVLFNGQDGFDYLYGSDHSDVFYAGPDGAKMVGKRGGDAFYDGGTGNSEVDYSTDQVTTADVNMTLNGAADDGPEGVDLIGPCIKSVIGTSARDHMFGDNCAQGFFGRDGDDHIDGGTGADTLDGGAGNNTLYFGTRGTGVAVALSPASPNPEGDAIFNFQTIYGSPYGDTIYGSDAGETIHGEGGSDAIDARGGNDIVTGGPGPEWDDLRGGAGADVIDGGPGADTLVGNGANDILHGGADGDHMWGEDGADDMWGEAGADDMYGDAGNDNLYGGADTDWLYGRADNDSLDGEGSGDYIVPGTGSDKVDYIGRGSPVAVSVGDGLANDGQFGEFDQVLASDDQLSRLTVVGTIGPDVFVGSDRNETFSGADGDDTFDGRGGADDFIGGAHNSVGDTVVYYGVEDAIVDPGVWVSIGDGANDGVPNAEYDNVYGDIENVRTGSGDDRIVGSAQPNRLQGGTGNDTIYGNAGNDTIEGALGDDTLYGGNGPVTADPTFGNDADALFGGPDNDKMYGEDGSDTLVDNSGVDWLEGGVSDGLADTMNGVDGRMATLTGVEPIYPGDAAGVPDTFRCGYSAGGANKDKIFYDAGDVGSWDTLACLAEPGTVVNYIPPDTTPRGLVSFVLDGAAARLNIDRATDFEQKILDLIADRASKGLATESTRAQLNDQLRVAPIAGGQISVTDLNGVLRPGGSCVQGANIQTVVCPAPTELNIGTGLGDDQVDNLTSIPGNISLGAGNDHVVVPPNRQIIDGNLGNDTLWYKRATGATVSVTFDGTHNDGAPGENDVLYSFENVSGSYEDDYFLGDASSNKFNGGGGNDVFDYGPRTASANIVATLGGTGGQVGTSEIDTLGADVEGLTGGLGNDTLTGNALNNTLRGGPGDDKEYGRAGDDVLIGGIGTDEVYGEAGTDTASYATHSAGVVVDLDGVRDDGNTSDGTARDLIAADVENITGSPAADTLTGNASNNTIDGGLGGDDIFGLGGTDTIIYTRTGQVQVDLRPANDNLPDSSAAATWDGEPGEKDDVRSDFENVIAVASPLVFQGNDGANTVYALGNVSIMLGNGGNDSLFGSPGVDLIDGGAGDDWLVGGSGNDGLTGGPGRDSLDAGDGDDFLRGYDKIADAAVLCGNGNDGVWLDGNDPANSCERLQLPSWNAASFSSPLVIAPGIDQTTGWGGGRVDTVFRDQLNNVWHRYKTCATCAWQLTSLGVKSLSDPTITSWGANRLDVFIRAENNHVWQRAWFCYGWWCGWGGWVDISNDGLRTLTISSAPDATNSYGDRIGVFARGTDGTLWGREFFSGEGWSQWVQLNYQVVGGPGATATTTSSHGGNYDVYIRDTTNHVIRVGFINDHSTYIPLLGFYDRGTMPALANVVAISDPDVDFSDVVVRDYFNRLIWYSEADSRFAPATGVIANNVQGNPTISAGWTGLMAMWPGTGMGLMTATVDY